MRADPRRESHEREARQEQCGRPAQRQRRGNGEKVEQSDSDRFRPIVLRRAENQAAFFGLSAETDAGQRVQLSRLQFKELVPERVSSIGEKQEQSLRSFGHEIGQQSSIFEQSYVDK